MQEFEELVALNRGGNCIALPVVSLFYFSEEPISVIGGAVADVIESYFSLGFGANLTTKFKQSGVPGPLSERAIRNDLNKLRAKSPPPRYRIVYDSHSQGWVGTWGIHFDGVEDVDDPSEPGLTNMLRLDFSLDLMLNDRLEEAARELQQFFRMLPPGYGYCSYTLKRSEGTLRSSRRHVNAKIARFRGLDPCYHPVRFSMRGKTFSAHWLDVLDAGKFGSVRDDLARIAGSRLEEFDNRLLVRCSRFPSLGDSNRQANDHGFVPEIARLLRPTRSKIAAFGDAVLHAQAWLGRYDELDNGLWENGTR